MKKLYIPVLLLLFFFKTTWTLDSQHNQMRDYEQYYENLILEKKYLHSNQDQVLLEVKATLLKNKAFIDDLLNTISQQKKNLEQELDHVPQKLCERTICGNSWFVWGDHHEVLRAEVPIVAPAHLWRSFNCQIMVNKISEKQADITIIPDAFPIFGNAQLKGATWKAELWLEAKSCTKPDVDPKLIQEKIRELSTCEDNLLEEKNIILLKLKAYGITTT